ncbi:MAG: hypothetical protein JNN12_06745 [Bacteroidetes Order II. Incertae sedis bacterium]|nr:hypothetical protein [Bacteroidetes Order II. bacterium]
MRRICGYLSLLFMLCASPSVEAQATTETAHPSEDPYTALRKEALRKQDPTLYYRKKVQWEKLAERAKVIKPINLDEVGLGGWFQPLEKETEKSFYVGSIQHMPRPKRKWFLDSFRDADWTGAPLSRPSVLDTMRTAEIRALLQSLFGSPSSTIFDVPPERRRSELEHVQFEYYLVVNDTIPVMIMDGLGPKGKGVIFAGDWADENVLPLIKHELIRRMMHAVDPKPYIDFYYDPDVDLWYKTGFDGNRYFTEQIKKPKQVYERPYFEEQEPAAPTTGKG